MALRVMKRPDRRPARAPPRSPAFVHLATVAELSAVTNPQLAAIPGGSAWHRPTAAVIERCEKIDLADLKQHSATLAEDEGVEVRVPERVLGSAPRTTKANPQIRCPVWVRRGRSEHVRCTSASPLNTDDMKRRPNCPRRAKNGDQPARETRPWNLSGPRGCTDYAAFA